ncbi:MAG: hypothetical protein QOI83_1981 [Streptomycetaceae bacterium]|nr:hypothetical protein [Streptomycetaceae bacterium]
MPPSSTVAAVMAAYDVLRGGTPPDRVEGLVGDGVRGGVLDEARRTPRTTSRHLRSTPSGGP